MRTLGILLAVTLSLIWTGNGYVAVAADSVEKIFQDVCLDCHKSGKKRKQIDNAHLNRQEWKEAFDRMLDQGAEIPQDRIPDMIEYLLKEHGPVAGAPAAEAK